MQVVGQPLQPRRLSPVQGGVALGVVAHQHLAERGIERVDVLREVLAVLEIELRLTALFGGARGRVSVRRRVAKDGGPELLVHQDAGLVFRNAASDGGQEAVVDDLLGGGDLRGLVGAERALPPEQLLRERAAVIEGHDVQRLVVADGHDGPPLALR